MLAIDERVAPCPSVARSSRHRAPDCVSLPLPARVVLDNTDIDWGVSSSGEQPVALVSNQNVAPD